jgi:hypothetical protein
VAQVIRDYGIYVNNYCGEQGDPPHNRDVEIFQPPSNTNALHALHTIWEHYDEDVPEEVLYSIRNLNIAFTNTASDRCIEGERGLCLGIWDNIAIISNHFDWLDSYQYDKEQLHILHFARQDSFFTRLRFLHNDDGIPRHELDVFPGQIYYDEDEPYDSIELLPVDEDEDDEDRLTDAEIDSFNEFHANRVGPNFGFYHPQPDLVANHGLPSLESLQANDTYGVGPMWKFLDVDIKDSQRQRPSID